MQNFRESDALYLRKSRMDPDSESIEETLARHEDTLMKLAVSRGLNITGVYKEVKSGDGLFTRPQMVQLLQDVGQGKYTGIVCMEIDRLGRSSQKDSGIIFETLKEHDVAIITPNKTYDLNNEFDETSVEMQSFIARQELKSIKRRLRKGAEKTCEQGGYIAEPPYGYRRAYIDKRPTLEIHEEEANVIRMVFDWYVNQRLGTYTIADKLNNMGYKPRKGDNFSRTTVRFYLQNPTYTGKIIWNKQRHIRPKFVGDKHKSIPNSEDKWIIADGIHPAIISQELFDEAQRIRLTRTHPPSYTGTLQNPFAGLIYCKNCGSAMQRQYSKRSGNRLLCVNTNCNRSIKAEYVEMRILSFLKKLLAKCRTTSATNSRDEMSKKVDMINASIRDMQKNLKALNTQKSSLHDFLENGVYDVPTFLERNTILSEKITKITSSVKEEEQKLSAIQKKPSAGQAIPMLQRLLNNYFNLTPAEKNELLKLIISRMDYLRTPEMKGQDFQLDIELNYSI